MKKNIILTTLTAVLMSACTSNTIDTPSTAEVTFDIPLPYVMVSIDSDDLTHGTRASLSEASCTSLYIFVDGILTKTQASTDTDFGSPTLSLTYGEHSIAFVATTAELTVGGSTFKYSDNVVKDTFGKTITLTVSSTMGNQSVTLERIISSVRFTVEDAIPTGTSTATIALTNHYQECNSTTMTANTSKEFSREFNISSKVGVPGLTFNAFTFCPSLTDEWQTDATITFKKSDGTVVATHTINDVDMLTNRRTNISGNMFAKTPSAVIEANTDWLTDNEVSVN